MMSRDKPITALPFEFHGNEVLLKGLLARYPKAFRRVAQRFETENLDYQSVAVPDRNGHIRFFKSDTTIGVSYIGPTGRRYQSFGDSFSQMISDNVVRNSAKDSPRYGLMQRALNPATATQLSEICYDDFT